MNDTINITNTTELKKIVCNITKNKPENFSSLTFKFIVSRDDSVDMSALYNDLFWFQKRNGSLCPSITVLYHCPERELYLIELKGSHYDVSKFLTGWLIFLLRRGDDNETI